LAESDIQDVLPYNWRSASTGNTYNIGVTLLNASSELPEESIAMCPGIFQRYIEKIQDIRVTVIGNRYFSVRMHRRDGSAYTDWRKHMLDEDLVIEECFASPCRRQASGSDAKAWARLWLHRSGG
jgi:hypothetical protein